MAPLFAKADLLSRGIIRFGPLSQQRLPTTLARAEPAAGVPRKSVHIVIVGTVVGGIAIFAIGLVVIYQMYMKRFDREQRHRQSQLKKDGTAKEPMAPKPSKTLQEIGSHNIHGKISQSVRYRNWEN